MEMIPRAAADGMFAPLRRVCWGLGLPPGERGAAEDGIPREAPFEFKPKIPPPADVEVDVVVALLGGIGRRRERVRVSELPEIGQIALGLSPRDLNFAANRSQEFRDPKKKGPILELELY